MFPFEAHHARAFFSETWKNQKVIGNNGEGFQLSRLFIVTWRLYTYHPTVSTIHIDLIADNNKGKVLWIRRTCLQITVNGIQAKFFYWFYWEETRNICNIPGSETLPSSCWDPQMISRSWHHIQEHSNQHRDRMLHQGSETSPDQLCPRSVKKHSAYGQAKKVIHVVLGINS